MLLELARADGEERIAAAARAGWRVDDGVALVRTADEHGLAPLLEHALGAQADAALGRSAALGLFGLCALERRRSGARQEALEEIGDRAEREGLTICWLKGAALASTVYRRPSLRPMGDLDLLVRPADEARAVALLAGLGFSVPGGDWRRRPFSHQLPRARRGEGHGEVVVEVHVDALSYLAPGSMVLGRNVTVEVVPRWEGERSVLTLGVTDTLAHLVAHAVNVRQRFTLIHLADVARWIERFGEQVDWDRLRRERPPVLRRLGWLAQVVPLPKGQLPPASRSCADVGVAYRGWSRRGWRSARGTGALGALVRRTLAPPEWWSRAQYGAGERTPVAWLRAVRHPAHLCRVALRRLIEG